MTEIKEIEATLLLRNNRLKKERLKIGYTQKNMAEVIGCSIAQYGEAECLKPTSDKIKNMIAEYFNKPIDYFFPPLTGKIENNKFVREISIQELKLTYEENVRAEIGWSQRRPEDSILLQEKRDKILSALKTLSSREEELMRMRYGLNTGYPMSLEAIGKVFNITRTRCSQIEKKCIRKLVHSSSSRSLREWIGVGEIGETYEPEPEEDPFIRG